MSETNSVFRTKESIRQSFMHLLEQHDISHIKASHVYSQARVSKATFYRYYRDVFDLLVECFELYLDIQDEVRTSIEEGNFSKRTYELILFGTRRIRHYPRLYLTCIQCTYAPFMQDFSARSIKLSEQSARRLIEERNLTDRTCAISIDSLAQLCIALSTEIDVAWAKNGCIETPESIAQFANTCILRFIDSMRVEAELIPPTCNL